MKSPKSKNVRVFENAFELRKEMPDSSPFSIRKKPWCQFWKRRLLFHLWDSNQAPSEELFPPKYDIYTTTVCARLPDKMLEHCFEPDVTRISLQLGRLISTQFQIQSIMIVLEGSQEQKRKSSCLFRPLQKKQCHQKSRHDIFIVLQAQITSEFQFFKWT